MRVLVTGTSGTVGAQVAREFLAHGYAVRGFDKAPPRGDDLKQGIEVIYGDLTARFDLLRATEGCDAIAHLAAIPNPGHSDEEMFAVNVTGTQQLLAAAEAHGIRRVALASTCCAFGIFFALHPFDPQYLPMDEKHPNLPQDLYGLSKLLNEETAAAYTRRSGMTTVSLRLTSVVRLNEDNRWRRWRKNNLQSDAERADDLWSYIDRRDAARAFRLAIENAREGTNTTAIIAARDSMTTLDIRDLVRKHFPALAEQVADLAPTACLYDTKTAEDAFGFVAEHLWRDEPFFDDVLTVRDFK
ncbi:MAG: NAD(P)-dependent oxidoreductase [Cytophagales bacterium]|nr:NAD(P)-dependent oxidoreductase [Armatimonadota bacterium]